MDNSKYNEYQRTQFQKFEGICKKCGECCGSKDRDPCAKLIIDPATGKCHCMDYDNRLGSQKTQSGKIFDCVTIRDIAKRNGLRVECAYNIRIT